MTDLVNNPPHYCQGNIECLDAMEAMLGPEGFANYLRGTIMKYLWRAPHKGAETQDFQKAQFYMHKLVELSEKS